MSPEIESLRVFHPRVVRDLTIVRASRGTPFVCPPEPRADCIVDLLSGSAPPREAIRSACCARIILGRVFETGKSPDRSGARRPMNHGRFPQNQRRHFSHNVPGRIPSDCSLQALLSRLSAVSVTCGTAGEHKRASPASTWRRLWLSPRYVARKQCQKKNRPRENQDRIVPAYPLWPRLRRGSGVQSPPVRRMADRSASWPHSAAGWCTPTVRTRRARPISRTAAISQRLPTSCRPSPSGTCPPGSPHFSGAVPPCDQSR